MKSSKSTLYLKPFMQSMLIIEVQHSVFYKAIELNYGLKVKRQLCGTSQIITHTMIRRRSMQSYSLTVSLGRIPLIALPIIIRIFLCQTIHILITKRLCKNTRCRNRLILAITLYYSCIRYITIRFKSIAIHNNSFRTNLKLVKSTMHCKKTRIQNINLIYLLGSYNAYSPRYCIPDNLVTQLATTLLRQLLRIIKHRIIIIIR